MNSEPDPSKANRLAAEKSPYLRQHAANPVDWFPWGEEAFAKARAEDKPIFLSIGYSTCHWCHVMAHESFENQATADLMNARFVNIKVDREERPDVDRVYMTFVQATTGSGGWPMSVWLQPDLKPFIGGTYFPPENRFGRRSFGSVCEAIARAWREDRAGVAAQSDRILDALQQMTLGRSAPATGAAAGEIAPAELLRLANEPLAQAYDPEWGGFGDAPKFPRPVTLHLLARVVAHGPPEAARSARESLFGTLENMAEGGMHDQLGGGFHRYSVDRFWHVPHFEKMLYDQAQLAIAYLEAFSMAGDPAHARVVRGILDYVARDLTSPEGGFYCAEDADSLIAKGRPEHAEGAFYVWTKAEIEQALDADEAAAFCLRHGVKEAGNAPAGSDPQGEFTGKNILTCRTTIDEVAEQLFQPPDRVAAWLESARKKLLAARDQRPRPHLDDKVITAWNGLMISAYARAYRVLGEEGDLAAARNAAAFIHTHLWNAADGSLLRSFREGPSTIPAFADDYAFLIQGLLDLYEAGFDLAHLVWAEQLQDRQDALFYDMEGGGYFAAAANANVLLRLKEDHDGAEPAASSVSALNLARLAAFTGREELGTRALETVRTFGAWQQPARLAQTMPLMLVAAEQLSRPPAHLVIAGERDADDTRALLHAAGRCFAPGIAVLLKDDGAAQDFFAARLPFVANLPKLDGRATAYLCENGTCQLPTTDPAVLTQMLANPKV